MKIYLSEPVVDGAAWVDDQAPLPATAVPAARRGLRNWQKFVLCYLMAMSGVLLLVREVVLRTGGNAAGGMFVVAVGACVALASVIVVLTLAGRLGRL